MFSLFHKDSSTLSEAKPGDQTPVGVEQSGAASLAGVGQAPSAVSVPPRLEANARGVVVPALAAETALRTGEAGADAAGIGSAGRHETAPGAVGRNSEQQFERLGPAGLLDQPRGASSGSRWPELTKRTILMLKEQHPDWGCQRISDLLLRGPALPASASAVARVLHEAGYEAVEETTHPHPDHVRRFERAQPNQLWQTALFADLAEARARIGHFIDNFQRPHRGADGLVPADRFFQAAPTVLQTLKERVAANALELARYGQPQTPFYVTGQVAGQTFSVHAEGERLVLRRQGQGREEIELTSPGGTPPSPSSGASGEGLPAVTTAGPRPTPLCPDGSPRPEAGEPACAAPPAPGQTSLDLVRLAEGLPVSPAPSLPEALSTDNQSEEGGA